MGGVEATWIKVCEKSVLIIRAAEDRVTRAVVQGQVRPHAPFVLPVELVNPLSQVNRQVFAALTEIVHIAEQEVGPLLVNVIACERERAFIAASFVLMLAQ